jgi:hypothetical protein
MRRRRLLTLPLALAACNIWRPYTPVTLYFREPKAAFDATVATLGRLGYAVRADRQRYHVEVASKLEATYIGMQIYGDARMIIRPYGKLVRGSTVHRKIEDEIASIVVAVRASGQVVR